VAEKIVKSGIEDCESVDLSQKNGIKDCDPVNFSCKLQFFLSTNR